MSDPADSLYLAPTQLSATEQSQAAMFEDALATFADDTDSDSSNEQAAELGFHELGVVSHNDMLDTPGTGACCSYR